MRIRKYVEYGLSDPLAVPAFLRGGARELRMRSLRRTAELIGVNPELAMKFFSAIRHSDFCSGIEDRLAEGGKQTYGQVESKFELYTIVRSLQPSKIVETGVASGVSSAFILKALQDNGKGNLYSIDFPNYENAYFPTLGLEPVSLLPDDKPSGFVVPDFLRARWRLSLGLTRDLLPRLLKELGSIDLFFHDSEHTFENMIFEYREAWEYLGTGGILLSDDIGFNKAFKSFCREVGRKPTVFPFLGLGCVKK